MYRNISGVILAGGANKRFGGKIKANLLVEGKPIISRILETITGIFDEIIIVTNTPDAFENYNEFKIEGDRVKNIGPLGGIHAALLTTSGDAVFIFAADMPFPDINIINTIVESYRKGHCRIVVPRVGSLIEPLLSIYDRSLLSDLEDYISRNKSVAIRNFISYAGACYLELEKKPEVLKTLTNINRPSDIERLNTW